MWWRLWRERSEPADYRFRQIVEFKRSRISAGLIRLELAERQFSTELRAAEMASSILRKTVAGWLRMPLERRSPSGDTLGPKICPSSPAGRESALASVYSFMILR
jgi:hypothetical protein